ncbi:uncharacterized protein LOC131303414 isoform X2 [Rhododendron vialii]|uniref:uncharacterized protein LOC131303414 isoform X2 n=1 Tax=Rhododendron vialii TaxID=182163 RepID=UPI00265F69B5|nr:uncharacterized protein LOC131303414 isoform X2 [Rhododendron vialii]
MGRLSPDCPTGAVWFVQEMGSRSINWNSVRNYLRTEESLEDYAKFRHSLMDNFSSLVLSATTENEVPFGWYANIELRTLETYYFIASLRSSRHKRHAAPMNEMFQDVLPEWKGFSYPMGSEVHGHNFDLASELRELKHIHSYYAYAKSLSKCDFIKLDSDFEEIFQRLKSENRWPELSDDFLRALLENHFSLLHELNDNLSVMDVSAGNRLKGNRVLEAINKLYAKEFGDITKNYEELWINKYFVPHMNYKSMVQKNLDRAQVLRTEYITQVLNTAGKPPDHPEAV